MKKKKIQLKLISAILDNFQILNIFRKTKLIDIVIVTILYKKNRKQDKCYYLIKQNL